MAPQSITRRTRTCQAKKKIKTPIKPQKKPRDYQLKPASRVFRLAGNIDSTMQCVQYDAACHTILDIDSSWMSTTTLVCGIGRTQGRQ